MASFPFTLNPFSAGLPGVGSLGFPPGFQFSQQPLSDFINRIGIAPPVLPFSADPVTLQQTAAAAQQAANVEAQATSGFMQDAASNAIRKLYEYVNANSQKFNQLSTVMPVLGQAVESYRLRDFVSAFSQAFQAYRAVCLLRTTVPDLPALPAA
jgi:hypothetical protein